jgi:hypothetical protein
MIPDKLPLLVMSSRFIVSWCGVTLCVGILLCVSKSAQELNRDRGAVQTVCPPRVT